MMLVQEQMIERVREICRQDQRLVAAVMYGSLTKGLGDRYSDIEFELFFQDDKLAGVDQQAWIEQIAPVAVCYRNEYGNTTVVFENLIRGEFHFEPLSGMSREITEWAKMDYAIAIEPLLVLDRTGELTPLLQQLVQDPPDLRTPEKMQYITNSFFNWYTFGLSVLRRGEYARAFDLLSWSHRNLLWMARALEGKIANWLTPSRLLEKDISPSAYERFLRCTSNATPEQLWPAYRECLLWAAEMLEQLKSTYGINLPRGLGERLKAVGTE